MIVSFQGEPGAFSHVACTEAFPGAEVLPCPTFGDCLGAVERGASDLALIPVENSVAGRVADVHLLLPESPLHIVGEHFLRVRHQLLGMKGASIAALETVSSHVHALSQCRRMIAELGLRAVVHHDTAAAARELSEKGTSTHAVIASSLAAQRYGLEILRSDVEDAPHNTTRFLVMAREARPVAREGRVLTTLVFEVRSVPAALYKALGGFATNGVNLTRLESYVLGDDFALARFFADIEGHPEETRVKLALEELAFFSSEVRVLGVYPAHPHRA